MMQVLKNDCGALADMIPNEDCPFEDTEAGCKNEQNCEWKTPSGTGTREPDQAGTKCVITPPKGSCQKKTQSGEDANTEMMKKLCPGVESMDQLQKECETKPTNEQISCATEKCPIMGMFIGAALCGFGITQDACTTFGDKCNWDGVSRVCVFNSGPVFDKLVPRSCPMRPSLKKMMVEGSLDADAITQKAKKCTEARTEDACGAAGDLCL